MKIRIQLTYILLLMTHVLLAQSAGGYTIKHRHVDVDISTHGRIAIEEKLLVNFSEKRRGIYRSIPYIYHVNGKEIRLPISKIKVSNHNQKITKGNGQVKIRIGHPDIYLTGDQEYVISYEVANGIADMDTHDEFYWDLIDFDTDATTDKASFAISVPKEWASQITEYKAYSGRSGSTDHQLVIHRDGNELVGASNAALAPREGVTLAIKFPKGLIAEKDLQKEYVRPHWLWNWWNIIPAVLGSLLLFFWRKIDGQPKIEGYPLQYYPPEGMTSAEVGTFVDHYANRRDVISLLPYWGNQGILKVKPVDGSDGDVYFYRLTDLPADATDYERKLFDGLFADGDVVLLSDLKEKFYSTSSSTASMVKSHVLNMPLYDTRSKRIFHSGWMIGLGLVCIGVGIALGIISKSVLLIIAMILLGAFCLVIHFLSPRLSDHGISVKSHLLGLRDFLKNPDGPTINRLLRDDPDYLNKMYPYVLAFDLDRSWMDFEKSIEVDYHPPVWYDGPYHGGTFSYGTMHNNFDVRQVEEVMYSTPPPSNNTSSGGGFSGGSAGGGFGGGSTGSW